MSHYAPHQTMACGFLSMLFSFHRVPDHVVLSGGINNRYWVLEVEERPGQKTLTITCSKSLQPTETCLLKDGWSVSGTPIRLKYQLSVKRAVYSSLCVCAWLMLKGVSRECKEL